MVTLSGVLLIFGLGSNRGFMWHKRMGGGFVSLVAAVGAGFAIGLLPVLGAEALGTPEYFLVMWKMEGINQRQVVFGLIVGAARSYGLANTKGPGETSAL